MKGRGFSSFPHSAAFFGTILLFVSTGFLSCGLEDYAYINPVHDSDVRREFNSLAEVNLQNYDETTSFSNFVVFYRIYVSDTPIGSTTPDQYLTINSVLASDYNTIRPYIDSETLVNSNMDTLFGGRNYKYIGLRDADINDVLASSGNVLTFDFSSAKEPSMTVGDTRYTLMRSNGGGIFTPLPADRLFIHRDELWDRANINANTNADVENKTGMTSTSSRYTYAALFIAAVGMDTTSWSYIYSTPALIHVFMLPSQWQ